MLPELQSYQDTRCGELSIEAPLAKNHDCVFVENSLVFIDPKIDTDGKIVKKCIKRNMFLRFQKMALDVSFYGFVKKA